MDSKKVAIVTGASAGIGKATVERLLDAGYVVHAAARRLEAMRELEARGARVHALDLTRPESIEACVRDILADSGRVDLLVNNAAQGLYGAVEDIPLSAAREQMEVNLFGLVHMIQGVLPTMRAQRSGRIINVSSIGGKMWSYLAGWYHASKFALEGISDCLRNELRPFGIEVVVVEPGGTETAFIGMSFESMRRYSRQGPYRGFVEMWERAMARRGDRKTGIAPPGEIAEVILQAASAPRPKTRYVAPWSGRVMLGLQWALSDRAFDWLWMKLLRVPTMADLSSSEPRPPGAAS